MDNDKLTTEQAAAMLNYHIGHVQRMLRCGKLQGEKFGRTWIVTRDEIERIKAAQSPGGRYYSDRNNIKKTT